MGVFGRGRLQPDFQALDVADMWISFWSTCATPCDPVAINMQALRGLVDQRLERFRTRGDRPTLDHVVLVAKQIVQRPSRPPAARSSRFGRGDDRELDVAA